MLASIFCHYYADDKNNNNHPHHYFSTDTGFLILLKVYNMWSI